MALTHGQKQEPDNNVVIAAGGDERWLISFVEIWLATNGRAYNVRDELWQIGVSMS